MSIIVDVGIAIVAGTIGSQAKPLIQNLLFRYVNFNKDKFFKLFNPRVGAAMSTLTLDSYREETLEILYEVAPVLEKQPDWIKNALFDTVEDIFLPSAGLRSIEKSGAKRVVVTQMVSENDIPQGPTLKLERKQPIETKVFQPTGSETTGNAIGDYFMAATEEIDTGNAADLLRKEDLDDSDPVEEPTEAW